MHAGVRHPTRIPSPLLSSSPLSRSRGQKMRAQREGAEFYIWGGSLPPPCRAAGPLPPTGGAAGGLPPGRGAAGSLLKYKTPTLPSAPSFSAHEIQRGERERGGVSEVKVIGCSSLRGGGGELGTNKNLDLWLQLVCTKLKIKHAI